MGFWWVVGNSGVVGMVVVIGLFGYFNGFAGYLLGFFFFFLFYFFYFLIWVFGSGGILVGNGQWWCGGHGGSMVVIGLFGC